ncbi:MAG TPA: hypothetical protein P5567_11275 [Kiritimatiellia bacterium]|nr:hypothetical protein [Kiritimatiellia bacterium]HRZ13021.1 hypothetical protein [Kiritimatiellia bacterium]HSA18369.1 hypothetical protein [Kiritimatiellia bacterium]
MRPFNALLSIGLTGTFLFGSTLLAGLVQLHRGDPGHNWTHRDMRLSLAETRNRTEIYIGGELLQDHLGRKGLTATGPDGTVYPVVERDIRIRLNNWPERRAELAMRAILEAFLTGLSVAALMIGIVQARRRNQP